MSRLQSGGKVHITMAVIAGILVLLTSPLVAYLLLLIISQGEASYVVANRNAITVDYRGQSKKLISRWEVVFLALIYALIVIGLWAFGGWAIWRYILD